MPIFEVNPTFLGAGFLTFSGSGPLLRGGKVYPTARRRARISG
jgi:hypothetical protein